MSETTDQVRPVATRDEVLGVLRRAEPVVREHGATALYLFGSAARDDLGGDSDIDLFIDFDPRGPLSLFRLMDLEALLASLLGRPVDLTTRDGLHHRLKARIEASSIRVF